MLIGQTDIARPPTIIIVSCPNLRLEDMSDPRPLEDQDCGAGTSSATTPCFEQNPSAPATVGSALMTSLLNDLEIPKVYLIASDGTRIPAFRDVLASRSTRLKRSLYGEFKEANTKEIPCHEYSPRTLRAVVEFCLTDEITEPSFLEDNEASARQLVPLLKCAHYFDLPSLQDKVFSMADELMKTHPCLACPVFDEVDADGTTVMEKLRSKAIRVIRVRPRRSLLPTKASFGGGVTSLRSCKLKEIIRDKQIKTEELILFRALQKWARADDRCGNNTSNVDNNSSDSTRKASRDSAEEDTNNSNNDNNNNNNKEKSTTDRMEFARELIQYIDFSRINPSDLDDIVQQSGLVTNEAIINAKIAQAHRAQQEGFQFAVYRSAPQVERVLVSRALLKEVNGMYVRNGTYNFHPRYIKKGKYMGEESATFFVRKERWNWSIGVSPSGREQFYFCEDKGDRIPPINGWENDEGSFSVLTCNWLPGDPDDK